MLSGSALSLWGAQARATGTQSVDVLIRFNYHIFSIQVGWAWLLLIAGLELIGIGMVWSIMRRSNSMNAAKQYNIRLMGGMGAYAALLIGSITFIKAYPASIWRYPIALVPMLPAVWMVWAFMQYLRAVDELQRRIQLEALGFSFAGTALITFSYGFLQNVGFPEVNWLFVWPIMGVLWSIGSWVAHRRYCAE